MSESQLVSSVLQLLAIENIFAWRNNSGAFVGEYKGKSRFFRYGLKGSPDIFCVLEPSGRLVGVECKIGKNRQSPAQKQFQINLEKAGGLYWLIYDVQELYDRLQNLSPKR